MRITLKLYANLNKIYWDRRVWEIGYRGPPLSQRKAYQSDRFCGMMWTVFFRTGRPDYPISGNRIIQLRERFAREWEVMKCLATPFLSKEQEAPYIRLHGSPAQQREADELRLQQAAMPGGPKKIKMHKSGKQPQANVGNLLHAHRTVEDSLHELIRRQRWD
uniref:Pkinase_fungal domain-containing protein n=1 Tax=Ascaris lumbricoides TaxID=6252 RepID=A0A0M3IA52_ASCLU